MGVVVYSMPCIVRVANATLSRSTCYCSNVAGNTSIMACCVVSRVKFGNGAQWIETDEGSNGRIFCRPTLHSTLVPAGLSTTQAGFVISSSCRHPRRSKKNGVYRLGVYRLLPWHSYLGLLEIIRCTAAAQQLPYTHPSSAKGVQAFFGASLRYRLPFVLRVQGVVQH